MGNLYKGYGLDPNGGQFTTSTESLEVGYFPIEQALNMITIDNFKQRIKYCLEN